MTNTLVSHYTVTPTEPDGDIVAYRFANSADVWDYVTDTLGSEYGCDTVDIDGTDVIGFTYRNPEGFRIATVTVHYE
jgi:hypothetical protein